jgi:Uma2 family endonuclease
LSLADYLALERCGDTRYEYHFGSVYARAGGTIRHTLISGNAFNSTKNALRGKKRDCLTFNSEIKIEITPGGRYVYPDAAVACPPLQESEQLTGAITNPILLIEVLSEHSEGYDRGDKFKYYRTLPSLQEYLLIAQDKPAVTLYRRGKGSDLFRIIDVEGLDATLTLQSLGINLSLSDLSEAVELG